MINNKNLIRQTCRLKRRMLSETIQKKISQQVCLHIQKLEIYQHAKHIALYQAIEGEIDLTNIWTHAIQNEKQCYMPVMHQDKTLTFVQATPEDSTHTQMISLNQLDLMIMPLVAFDNYGTRLGRGAGYYDRTLANHRPNCLLGVAYAFQRQHKLIREPWDIPMDGIVTEEGIHWV